MSATDSAKTALRATGQAIKKGAIATKDYLSTLTLREALLVGAGVVTVIVLISQLLVGFWQRFLPSALITLVRLLVFVVVPMVAAASTVFGMWLERKYAKFDELHDWTIEKSAELHDFLFKSA
ncbi:Hypothetical Protein FCC1311_046052 [Hondaea fermentalgiana]|uniref:Uncharacterized protein n=1 Tax=Hondaea fermentalgiana TaxID=2315210 RepID=A0A2R5GBM4_9STRA|nr:Hypothetical Protein FCC1311_046052 [Hondaea fermentalgiana]|eukprot:GBG28382.1 Hypothetical Protein FCC1311_046052 [Hondaea fermentalgiana]